MILVNVGEYTINVEHVSAFLAEGEDTVVIFGNLTGKPNEECYSIRLKDEASKRMQSWLKKNSEGISEDSPGFAISAKGK